MSKIILFRNGEGYSTDNIERLVVTLKMVRAATLERGENDLPSDLRLRLVTRVSVQALLRLKSASVSPAKASPAKSSSASVSPAKAPPVSASPDIIIHSGDIYEKNDTVPVIHEDSYSEEFRRAMPKKPTLREKLEDRMRNMGSAYQAMVQYRQLLQEVSERPVLPDTSVLLNEGSRLSASPEDLRASLVGHGDRVDAYLMRINRLLQKSHKQQYFENFAALEKATDNPESKIAITSELRGEINAEYIKYWQELVIGDF